LFDYDWDTENILHIAEHDLTPDDVEYVLDRPTVDFGYQDWHGEERFAEVGTMKNGRILMIFTTPRGYKTRVVTPYDAPAFVVKEYLRRR
jgi:uncharacterized DUF497 family protein